MYCAVDGNNAVMFTNLLFTRISPKYDLSIPAMLAVWENLILIRFILNNNFSCRTAESSYRKCDPNGYVWMTFLILNTTAYFSSMFSVSGNNVMIHFYHKVH